MTLIDLTVPSLQQRSLDTLPVAIIGAGPVGLAAAANLVERGIDFVIYEAGDEIASSIRQWGHTRLFSPWKHVVDPASRRLLEATGWQLPAPESLPTGTELVEQYLEPLAALDMIADRIRTGVRVSAVTRQGMDRTRTARRAATPFLLRAHTSDGVEEFTARAVIDTSGTYAHPNSLGSSGWNLSASPRSPTASATPCPMCSAANEHGSLVDTPRWSAPGTRRRTPCWRLPSSPSRSRRRASPG